MGQGNRSGVSEQAGKCSIGVTNNLPVGMPLAQQDPVVHPSWPKYIKVWEGVCDYRQGQASFTIDLEGYRSATACETLTADWPDILQIECLISMDHMNNKKYIGKGNYMVFRTFAQHDFLGKLKEKKLCAVVHLPSQTLLLSVADVPGRLIGLLLPRGLTDY